MFARLAQFAAAALALVIGSSAQAAPVIYGTYYDETVGFSNGCSGSAACRINFAQLPADKLLMVSQISCSILSQALVQTVTLNVSATLGGAPLTRSYALSFPYGPSGAGSYSTNVQQNIHYLIGQARFPYIFVGAASSTGAFTVSCTIVGDLVTPIP